MTLWAIVPVKPLRRGKSRLADVLTEDERTLLNYTLLGNTLRTLSEVPEIDQVLVVSSDPSALALAREYQARTVQEDGRPGLSTAISRAIVVAQMYAAHDLLIIPADLPLISKVDIQGFISHAGRPPVIVIAPDRHEDGTNALLMSPPGVIEYRSGSGSYRHHIQQAQKKGVRVEVCQLSSFELDLDRPEDLELLKQIEAMKLEP